MAELSIIRPDDWHCHFRDGAVLADTVKSTAQIFGRAIAMPNLRPPISNVQAAAAYREQILAATAIQDFKPLMTLNFSTSLSREELIAMSQTEWLKAIKLYPAGVTTNSDQGIANLDDIFAICEIMQELNLRLLVHGEANNPAIDVFDREATFIEQYLKPLVTTFPQLQIVMEHITTQAAVDFVSSAGSNVGATITPHHLWYNRNDLLGSGLRPHLYCAPLLKTERDRAALVEAATSGDGCFFLGTDSAPHPVGRKESACGCAGVYNSPVAIEAYAAIFAAANKLDKLEQFASINGAKFYGMPLNTDTITLRDTPRSVPDLLNLGSDTVRPMLAGEEVPWQVVEGVRHG